MLDGFLCVCVVKSQERTGPGPYPPAEYSLRGAGRGRSVPEDTERHTYDPRVHARSGTARPNEHASRTAGGEAWTSHKVHTPRHPFSPLRLARTQASQCRLPATGRAVLPYAANVAAGPPPEPAALAGVPPTPSAALENPTTREPGAPAAQMRPSPPHRAPHALWSPSAQQLG